MEQRRARLPGGRRRPGPPPRDEGQAPGRLSLRHEIVLASMPAGLVLAGLLVVRSLATQPLLIASLASSAVSVYLDPWHRMNSLRTLVVAQLIAASVGLLVDHVVGASVYAAVVSLALSVVAMASARSVHPPAASTSLSFALRNPPVSRWLVFALVVGITASLIVLQRLLSWYLRRHGGW